MTAPGKVVDLASRRKAPPTAANRQRKARQAAAPRPPEASGRQLWLTLYRGARDPVPFRADGSDTWAELCTDLEYLIGTEAPEKIDLFAIGPHRLTADYRRDENVAAVTLLALDVDRCNADRLLARIEALGLAAAVYGSPSDDPSKPDARRVRVLAPASRPITPAECAATRCAFAELLELEPGQGVEACLAPSNLFFAGRIEGTPPRAFAWRDGAAVDIDGLLSVPLGRDWHAPKAREGEAPKANAEPLPEAEESPRAAELGELVRDRWLEGGRIESHAALNLFGWLIGRGWRRAELVAALDALDEDEPSAAKRAEHRRILSRAVALDGPGAARDWLGSDFEAVDRLANPEREAARAMLAERAARAPAGGDEEPPPIIVSSRSDAGAVFVDFGPDRGGLQPVAVEHVPRVLADLGLAPQLVEGRRGESPRALISRLQAFYLHTVRDFGASASRYDRATETLIVGYPLRPVEPREDADVDAWLRAVGGEDYPRLAAWIASCDQKWIDRLAAALVLVGPKDTGKSLLAIGLAGLWGRTQPPAATLLTARFNGSRAECPVLLDEEATLFGSGALSTKRFRDLIQTSEIEIEHKGREAFRLRGATRLIVPCNTIGDLKFADLNGPDVIAAVVDRLLVIDLAPRAAACRAALARLRLLNDWRVDLPRVVRHFAWLAATVTPPVERFIGGGGAAGRAAVLAGHAEEHPRVWGSLRAWLDGGDDGPWYAAGGTLACDVQALASRLAGTGDEGRAGAAVREALRPYRVGRKAQPRLADGSRPRCEALDAGGLADGLPLDESEREALTGRLEASKGRGLFKPGPDPRRPGGW